MIRYFITIDNDDNIISKKRANHSRTGEIEISVEDFKSIPDEIFHECGEPLFKWDGSKHEERTDKILTDKISQFEISSAASLIKAKNMAKLQAEIKEIAKQSLIDKGELTVEEAAEL